MPRKVTGYHETHESFVYVFVCGDYCKVGVAVDIEARLATLRCGNPHDIECHTAVQVVKWDAKAIEGAAHKRLADHRHRNEWFTCAPEVAAEVVRAEKRAVEDERAKKAPPALRTPPKPQEDDGTPDWWVDPSELKDCMAALEV